MSTKTLAAVVAVIAAAIIGGAVIWAFSDDDGDRREAELAPTSRATASALMLTLPRHNGGQPFAIDSFSIGATRAQGTTAQYSDLNFRRPLDAMSLRFVQDARTSEPQGAVRLTVQGTTSTGKPVDLLRYDLGNTLFNSGDESAPGSEPGSATQAIALTFGALQEPTAAPDLQYAPSTGAIGQLEISGVTEKSTPAYVAGYSWGWEINASGIFTVKRVTVERALDSHAPWFWQQLTQGNTIQDMALVLQRASTKDTTMLVEYMRYKLSNVTVTSVQDSVEGEQRRQQITLDFASVLATSGTEQVQFGNTAKAGL